MNARSISGGINFKFKTNTRRVLLYGAKNYVFFFCVACVRRNKPNIIFQ